MIKKSVELLKISFVVMLLSLLLFPFSVRADDSKVKSSMWTPVEEEHKLIITEYSDFQCYYCARVQPAVKKVMKNYGDKVKIVFKQFPLTGIHPNALISAKASLAAQKQGKFWQLHDIMFENQKKLSKKNLISFAEQIGLDIERFKKDLSDKGIEAKIMSDMASGRKLGIRGTPAFIIGDTKVIGAVPYEKLSSEIEKKLKELPNYKKKKY